MHGEGGGGKGKWGIPHFVNYCLKGGMTLFI